MKSITIKEAEKKVCPFMQYQEDAQHELYNTCCIANDCMAWNETKTHEQIENEVPKSNLKADMAMSRYRDGEELTPEKKEGFCRRMT